MELIKPSEQIRDIWDEMKELKRIYENHEPINSERCRELALKYEEIEILFGHESTLSKAIIYYLDNQITKII